MTGDTDGEAKEELGLRVARIEPWDAWVGEPGFSVELADRFRELLPLFERMCREPESERPRAGASVTAPRA